MKNKEDIQSLSPDLYKEISGERADRIAELRAIKTEIIDMIDERTNEIKSLKRELREKKRVLRTTKRALKSDKKRLYRTGEQIDLEHNLFSLLTEEFVTKREPKIDLNVYREDIKKR